MLVLPVTLTAAGLAALLNIWIAFRVGRVRGQESVMVGDGGNARLIAAMRAHANYVEYTPFVLILIGLIEAATGSHWWLWAVALVYLLARVAHVLGMTEGNTIKLRMIGVVLTMLTLAGLGLYAVALPHLDRTARVAVIDEG